MSSTRLVGDACSVILRTQEVVFLERRFGFCQRTKWRQMEDTYNKNQWKFMEEMCILVDSQDRPIGSDSKRNCTVVALA